MPPRRFKDAEEIVQAAAELFERRGYQNTTIDDIAQHLGISKPTVYQYIDGKGSLLEQIVERVYRRLLMATTEALESSDDPDAQLGALVRRHTLVIAGSVLYFRILFGEEKELPPKIRKKFDRWQREIADTVCAVIARCQREGSVWQEIDPKVGSFLIVGMLASMARWYEPGGSLTPEELADQAVALLYGGMRS